MKRFTAICTSLFAALCLSFVMSLSTATPASAVQQPGVWTTCYFSPSFTGAWIKTKVDRWGMYDRVSVQMSGPTTGADWSMTPRAMYIAGTKMSSVSGVQTKLIARNYRYTVYGVQRYITYWAEYPILTDYKCIIGSMVSP